MNSNVFRCIQQDSNSNSYACYSYYNELNSNDLEERHEACYDTIKGQDYIQYNSSMLDTIAEANLQDYYYYCLEQLKWYQSQKEYMNDTDGEYEEEIEEINNNLCGLQYSSEIQQQQNYDYYQNDSLLHLVVNVQNYLAEQADYYNHLAKN
ncbi:uncharacterized protein BX663DRAFT_517446, partial [Cokeromyces recurvatus]|uniref:uncharacterized protein n=1 Tax=Cokeromyces recurvatus TaxID=90255 RepID=UPI00221FAF8F